MTPRALRVRIGRGWGEKEATAHEEERQCRSRERQRVGSVQDDEPVKALIVALNVGRDVDPVGRFDLARVDQRLVLVNRVPDPFPLCEPGRDERREVDGTGRGLDSDGVRVGRVGVWWSGGRRSAALASSGGPLVEGADGGAVGKDGFASRVVEPEAKESPCKRRL